MDESQPSAPRPSADRVAEPLEVVRTPLLTEQYLRWIAEIERMPGNQSGQDKSWLRERTRLDAEHFARVKRIR
jgi:hypothetical protein